MDKKAMDAQKEKIMNLVNDKNYQSMKVVDIEYLMAVPVNDKAVFGVLLDELVKSGKLVITKKGKVLTPEKLGLICGTFKSNARGFGFVTPDDKSTDIFIPPSETNGARHKDRVLCCIDKSVVSTDTKKLEGEIVEILTRGMVSIIGTFEEARTGGFVIPDEKKMSQDIFIPKNQTKGAVTGSKVAVWISDKKTGENPEGAITEILGHKNDPGIDILSIIMQNDVPIKFLDSVISEAEAMPDEVLPDEIKGRTDLRDTLTITIDGEDTKDIDDAVSLSRLENGNYQLGVHIADVSHYVKENSAIMKEAINRGTSVYLVDRVIPMLPHKLSNGICSLNPNVDRLALSCIMEIDGEGKVVTHEMCESVINSKMKMTYEKVNEMLTDENSPLIKEYAQLFLMFKEMETLAAILREKRIKRGAIEFDFPECKVLVDKNCVPIDIVARQRNTATGIIEEFMLISNETVAERFFWLELPFVYRTHEEPDPEKLEGLSIFVQKFGYGLRAGKAYAKSLQKLLAGVDNSPEAFLINKVVLRSMKQARYTPENLGHFGLAAKYYCHFTSPIRRLPDLLIHRIIKDNINSRLDDARITRLAGTLPELCVICSTTERRAEETEREVESAKKAQFMEDKAGQVFSGIISGVTSWGIYVALPNTVEGMVSANDLQGDRFIFDEENLQYRGDRTAKTYRMGDSVEVTLLRADRETGRIDFSFEVEEEQGQQ